MGSQRSVQWLPGHEGQALISEVRTFSDLSGDSAIVRQGDVERADVPFGREDEEESPGWQRILRPLRRSRRDGPHPGSRDGAAPPEAAPLRTDAVRAPARPETLVDDLL